jgi:hypothetical protein
VVQVVNSHEGYAILIPATHVAYNSRQNARIRIEPRQVDIDQEGFKYSECVLVLTLLCQQVGFQPEEDYREAEEFWESGGLVARPIAFLKPHRTHAYHPASPKPTHLGFKIKLPYPHHAVRSIHRDPRAGMSRGVLAELDSHCPATRLIHS